MLEINTIHNMDCLKGLKLLEDNSIDSIVTDPPYELGFMGKSWDSTGIAYNIEVWKECLRVLKHGGHLLAFGGTRTYHRMVCAIEDAGFEIRDQIQWIYGSGFPKSMDISKAIDKKLGAKREIVGEYKHPTAKNGKRTGTKSPYQAEDSPLDGSYSITTPSTDLAKQWEGWGTALKPANEPIVVARKPLSEKTVIENVLKWGTGGINIDDCRIEHSEPVKTTNRKQRSASWNMDNCGFDSTNNTTASASPLGRFPANVILDEEAGEILDEQTGILKSGLLKAGHPYGLGDGQNVYGKLTGYTKQDTHGDSGGASRFFYCAKASKKERGEGNTHPTVKPLKLISYLITLVTPPNGICLDIFEGSGTHALACIENEFKYIGFEKDENYHKIALSRIEKH